MDLNAFLPTCMCFLLLGVFCVLACLACFVCLRDCVVKCSRAHVLGVLKCSRVHVLSMLVCVFCVLASISCMLTVLKWFLCLRPWCPPLSLYFTIQKLNSYCSYIKNLVFINVFFIHINFVIGSNLKSCILKLILRKQSRL